LVQVKILELILYL